MMNRFARGIFTASALSLGLALAGCGSFDPSSFDPTAIFDMEIFNTKKKLPGERKAVFPEGTPGVPQGVPEELVKGHTPPEQAEPAAQQADAAQPKAETKPETKPEAKAEAKPKPKPKPKLVAKPKDESTPTAVTVRPAPSQAPPQAQAQSEAPPQAQAQPRSPSQVQWPDPPPMHPQPTTAWPSAGQSSGGVAWPDPPSTAPR